MSHLSSFRLKHAKDVVVLSVLCAFSLENFFQPAAVSQGGYDTTGFDEPDEAKDQGPASDQELQQKGDKKYVPGTSKYYQPTAVNDVDRWFAQYDDIRRKYESTPDERQYFDQLMNKPPGSGLSEGDQKFLEDMAGRYAEAFNQIKELDAMSETQQIHRGYAIFATQQSNLCLDCMRVLSDPKAVDKAGRPIAGTLADKRRVLYQLEKTNRLMDMRTRQTFNVGRNQYEQSNQRQE